jgi:hypothetical protein
MTQQRRLVEFQGETYDARVDNARLLSATQRVLARLLDHAWHTRRDLEQHGGGAAVHSRIADLRHAGLRITSRRAAGAPERGLWEYRLDHAPDDVVRSILAQQPVKPRGAPV